MLYIGSYFVNYSEPVYTLDALLNWAWIILELVWGFKARNALNFIYNFKKGSEPWFHGFWTFLFTQLYFNYKVNSLNERLAEAQATQ